MTKRYSSTKQHNVTTTETHKEVYQMCIFCYGKGVDLIRNPHIPCVQCGGKGQFLQYTACPLCMGTGKSYDARTFDDRCVLCNGDGIVEKKD